MKLAISLLALGVVLVGVGAFYCGKSVGVTEGQSREQRRWEDAAGNKPYLIETPGRFYYVRKWHGEKPLPDLGILE